MFIFPVSFKGQKRQGWLRAVYIRRQQQTIGKSNNISCCIPEATSHGLHLFLPRRCCDRYTHGILTKETEEISSLGRELKPPSEKEKTMGRELIPSLWKIGRKASISEGKEKKDLDLIVPSGLFSLGTKLHLDQR